MGIAPHTDVFNVKTLILFNVLFLRLTFTGPLWRILTLTNKLHVQLVTIIGMGKASDKVCVAH